MRNWCRSWRSTSEHTPPRHSKSARNPPLRMPVMARPVVRRGELQDLAHASSSNPNISEGRMALRLCAQPLRFPVQSKGEWLAILWLKVVSTTPLKRPNWFARDCAPLVQSKSKKYLRTMCSSKGERRSSKSMAPWCVVSRPFMNATPTENVEKFSGLRRAGCAICGWRETRCY
jgi:hypothetical protein